MSAPEPSHVRAIRLAEPEPPAGFFDGEFADLEPRADGMPEVNVDTDLSRVYSETLRALCASTNTYARGGLLVRVVASDAEEASRVQRAESTPTIRAHTPATLSVELSTVARFSEQGRKQAKAVTAPREIVAALLEAGAWPGIRPLVGVASSAILRPDGTVAQRPGYDVASGVFLAFEVSAAAQVLDDPTHADALTARDALLELVADFPFASEADRSAWLALVLTVFARSSILGPCPMWTVSANVRGAGKSRLVDLVAILATGRPASRATQPTDEAEAGKILTSIVLAGDELVLFDNLDRPLGGGKLDAYLTGDRWKDRLLGTNTTIDLPARAVLTATGNNVEPRGDTLRRILPVRLDSPHERPEERVDFAVANLLAHARTHRPRFVAAALTMLRAWFVAGSPRDGARTWGSFEAFASVVPPVLRWVGLADPLETRAGLEGEDPQLRALGVVFERWGELERACGRMQGVTLREAVDHMYRDGRPSSGDDLDDLREALETIAPGRGSTRVDVRALGHAFRRARRRVLGGRRLLELGVDAHNGGVLRWGIR